MLKPESNIECGILRSYPTYEEWKHCFIPVNSPNLSNPCSYPTYEEWKLTKSKL